MNKIRFEFETDPKSFSYCLDIVQRMIVLFNISENEALLRINRRWIGLALKGEDDLIYHEDEDYWANTIYFGKDSDWWKNPPNLNPLPLD